MIYLNRLPRRLKKPSRNDGLGFGKEILKPFTLNLKALFPPNNSLPVGKHKLMIYLHGYHLHDQLMARTYALARKEVGMQQFDGCKHAPNRSL